MGIEDVKNRISDELETLLSSEFQIDVTETDIVPHANDGAITFPNLDTGVQRCKVIQTAVLYIDIRRSTDLNLEHRASTVAKLYSSFVRAMTQCAAEYRGHVRGIIGDRLMVIFNPRTAFEDAVRTAILMNSVSRFILNRFFTHGEVSCGIGIDYGRMLATKTGIRRNGNEQHNYKSLVWLGRPANVASKLTDHANKTMERTRPIVCEMSLAPPPLPSPFSGTGLLGTSNPLLGALGISASSTPGYQWKDVELKTFLEHLKPTHLSAMLRHDDDSFRSFFLSEKSVSRQIPEILMTQTVYDGFRKKVPDDSSLKKNLWKVQNVVVAGYIGKIYGGNVFYSLFSKRE